MNTGELLTRGTIWVALAGYAAAAGLMVARRASRAERLARWLWTLGCAAYLGHVAAAFQFYHQWSHGAAYQETARQTAEQVGLNWAGGLYFNYAFTALWLVDVLWWWINLEARARRPRWLNLGLHAFLFFMVFNGAVVFATGPVRWASLAAGLALGAVWFVTRRTST